MKSIKTKLLVQTVASILFVAVLASASAIWVTVADYRERAQRRLTTYADQFAAELDRAATSMAGTLKAERNDASLRHTIKSLHETAAQDLGGASRDQIRHLRVQIIQHLRQTLRNKGFDQVAFYQGRRLVAYGGVDRVRLVAPDGTHRAPEHEAGLVRFENYLWQSVAPDSTLPETRPTLDGSRVGFRRREGGLTVEGATPVTVPVPEPGSYALEDTVVGTLVFRQKIHNRLLETFNKIVGISVDLIGPKGERVASTLPDAAAGGSVAPELSGAGRRRFATVERGGRTEYAVIRPYRHDGRRIAWIAAYTPRRTVIQRALDIVEVQIGWVALGLFLAGLFALVTGRLITRPVDAVARQMRDIASTRDFRRRVSVETRDEIGTLASSFNDMAAKLETADAALRKAEQKYRSIFENAAEGIFQTTPAGVCVTANPALVRMAGADGPEALYAADSLGDALFHDPAQWDALLATLESDGGVTDFEATLARCDGDTFPAVISARRITGEDGTPLVEGTVQDVTARKEKEKAVTERQAAEAATRAKSDFLARMSHEIRTPMNAVLGMTHRALKDDPGARQRAHLDKIRAAAESLLGILDDILDFSRIEAGRMTLDNKPFALDQVLETVDNTVRGTAEAKGLALHFDVAPETPHDLVGDPLRLGQVLLNLANNAVKFTDTGHVRVAVAADSLEAQQVVLRFDVHDTGAGISPEHLQTLFQPFDQGDSSVTREHGGTGLGLAVCRQLVDLMGGDFDVASTPGEGSTFTVTVPLGLADKPVPREHRRAVAPASLHGRRVLLVEDNALNREVATSMLDDAGIRVLLAENGEEALERVESERPDLVLMDIQMPVMDGLTATRRLRQTRRFRDLPVVAMTAHAMSGDAEKSLDAGMNDHITKPVDPDDLYATLNRWLATAETGGSQTGAPPPESARAGDPLHALPGVDTVAALKLVNGKRDRLKRMLLDFRAHYARTGDDAVAAVAEGRVEDAGRLGHALKASSGYMGMQAVADAAVALDRAGKAADADAARAAAERLRAALAEVMTGLDRLAAAENGAEGPS